MKKRNESGALFFAPLAALYAVNIPFSKLLLRHVDAAFMAGLLYFGAGVGMSAMRLCGRGCGEPPLTRSELPYVLAMIALDILAPICLMLGLSRASSANVSLLNNFEIVATALVALLLFGEKVSGVMWLAIGFITASSALLSFEGTESFQFSTGSLFVLAACCCWGLENNCTRRLSEKSAAQIVILKGIFSGLGSMIVAWIGGERFPQAKYAALVMLLGFVAYGLSIYFYVRAQKDLGAARTSACLCGQSVRRVAAFPGVFAGTAFADISRGAGSDARGHGADGVGYVPGRAQAEVSGAGENGRAPERAALRPQKRICEFSDKRIRRKCRFFL